MPHYGAVARPRVHGPDNYFKTPPVRGCPYLNGTCWRHVRDRALLKPVKGKSLRERYPEIASTLNAEASGFTASDVYAGSKALAVWNCPNGHTYCTTPNQRTSGGKGSGCGICSGKLVIPQTSLEAVAPDLAEQWDSERNGDSAPSQIAPNDNRLYWWKCPVADDHRWRASPNNRFGKGSGCRMCAGLEASSTNNLMLHTALMQEWCWALNEGVDPSTITQGNLQGFEWLCSRHPEEHGTFPQSPYKRISRGQGCPSCAGHVVTETNSLAVVNKDLAAQLDPTKAPFKTADEVSYGYTSNVWWRCPVWPELHSWDATPNNRHSNDTGCPDCKLPGASRQEIRFVFELAAVLGVNPRLHKVEGVKLGNGTCLVDFLDPELRLAVEFDGSYWHKQKSASDETKRRKLEEEGWMVLRLRERPLALTGLHDVQVPPRMSPFDMTVVALQQLVESGLVDHKLLTDYEAGGATVAGEDANEEIRRRQVTGRPTIP